MRDGPSRVIERQIVPMNPAGKVDIFGIHKEAFIKQSGFHHGLGTEQHEATAEIGGIDRTGKIMVT